MEAEGGKTQFELPRGFAGRILLMSMNLGHKTIYKSVAKALELRAEDSLLEIACGNGHFIKNYASHVHSVAGLDLSELCIKLATKKNKKRIVAGSAEFVLGEATQLPWEDNKFSVATSMSSFLLFTKPVALESLKEMYRVLREGGYLFLTVPSMSLIRRIKALLRIYPAFNDSNEIRDTFYHIKSFKLQIFHNFSGFDTSVISMSHV